MSDKRIIAIAGPNGAGKTTFAGEFLPQEAQCPVFINADLIAAGLRYFESLYKPMVDDWMLLDNSGESPILIEWREKS